MPEVSRPAEAATLPVVGLGASAGGLEPLRQFMAQVPAHSGLAFVVVQHLDPTQPSLLVELLQRATPMPVVVASEALVVLADHVYVIPPNTELTLFDGRLHLALPHRPRGQRLPIDSLFESMAKALGSRAVGVVLSGLGADGTLGLRAIAQHGGLTLAQLPLSAQFDAMPAHAITAGVVHCVAPPGLLPAEILRWRAGLGTEPSASEAPASPLPPPGDDALWGIVNLLRLRHGHDLSGYKAGTLARRIARRMALHRLASMAAYEAHLRLNPQELDLLFKEMLIGVTSFFRDGPVWQELREQVLQVLLERRAAQKTAGDDQPAVLRAWVAGCSTGEEAYSLAMVFHELMDGWPVASFGLQIFATDLSADAIAFARKGLYPARIAQEVSPERLARFFVAQPAGYAIEPALRAQVLFAQHNVAQDPPFTRLDLLCCRNLLIYFDAGLQQRLLPMFHYSLRPGGALWLGRAEAALHAQALFAPVRPHARLYWRLSAQPAAGGVPFPANTTNPNNPAYRVTGTLQEPNLMPSTTLPVNLQSLADQLLLTSVAPPSVLATPDGDIVYVSGRTGRWLEPAAGKANWNLHAMARPGIRAQLASALRQAQQAKGSVELRGLAIDDDHDDRVDITVRAVTEPGPLAGMLLVVFKPAAAPARRRRRSAGAAGQPLNEDMALALAEVRALRDEANASREQAQAALEELQSTNEELQASNEELTTSKEESQSMNEELQTINAELQAKLDELALAQSDMQNLLNSTDIATLFLDKGLKVRRFTTQIGRIFQLRDSDIGRPLTELASAIDYPQMHADVAEVLRALAPISKAVATADGRRYSVRIVPYRTLADTIQGIVMTFVDITALEQGGPATR